MADGTAWWLDASARDLAMAHGLTAGWFHEGAAFHARQAAGKALEALLVARGVEARYPNGFGWPPRDFYDANIAGRAIEQAGRVLDFVRGCLA